MILPYTIGISPSLGIRGMIASILIRKGAIIEACPVVLLPISKLQSIERTILGNYYFDWSSKEISIVLGYGSLINHSYTPNAAYRWDFRGKKLVFYSLRDIKKGEEVLINYNGDPDDKTPLPPGWVSGT